LPVNVRKYPSTTFTEPTTGGAKTYRKMLVPLDGSEMAESVFVYAKELAARLDLELTLLHVCGPEERARGELVVGHPADEIARYADGNDVDLIMMATHGRSGIGRWAMGSVADDKWPERTILVPLDGSELAESVLPHVEELARQRDSELVDVVVFRVCEYAAVPDDGSSAEPSGWEIGLRREISQAKRAAEKYLARIEARFTAASIRARSAVLVGQPADVIVDHANGQQFGLVAMATHGRSGLSRLAFGSVAEKVLQGLSCPLFLVKPG